MTILVVTGTGTDVGKTVATAALAACASGAVAVVKVAQTGVAPGVPGDLAEITRLSGRPDVHEFARYPDPLSPHHAAQLSGLPGVDRSDAVARIKELDRTHDLVLVEGAGGLLVPYAVTPALSQPGLDSEWTLLDLAIELRAPLLLVTMAGLGTLNHTALTVRVIEAAAGELAGIMIGSWPAEPGLAERCNVRDLAGMAPYRELAGVLPAGMSSMRDFPEQARAALSPRLGGTFDWPAFRSAVRA
ncbi:MAG TPA: dethiobiotin synthase [Jatrophihabitantaceae bacterium]|jgi:dethiobiotin synthetase|nr:dethiobiotin synthase [Jatrophihabitantaceae bacterium]